MGPPFRAGGRREVSGEFSLERGPLPCTPVFVDDVLTLRPIGVLRSGQRVKFDARHQPAEGEEVRHVIELDPVLVPSGALKDLEGFSRIWLVWWFHKNRRWRPQVLPPRGPAVRRGVYATRSPHRPNPVGLTPVRLFAVEPGRLVIGPCDLLDGTPILDVKPYIPAYDAFPEEQVGWMGEVAESEQQPPAFEVGLSALAVEQAEWLEGHWGIDFRPRLFELLSRDPSPHRTRRIRRLPEGGGEIACGAWRAVFGVEGRRVTVLRLLSGYPVRFLEDLKRRSVPDREAQRAFRARWPQE